MSCTSLNVNSILCFPLVRNWIGKLELFFELYRDRSMLVSWKHFGPFFVQKPFYYEEKVPHVYLLHPPGGLVGGDQLNLKVYLGIGSHALLTMPGATKFYRSFGDYVYLRQRFNLSKNSILEWVPQSSIFFPKSKVIIDSKLQVSNGAKFIFFETLCFGRSFSRENFTRSVVDIILSISLENNAIGLKEHFRIHYSDEPILSKFAGCQISGIFFAMPSNVKILNDVRFFVKEYDVKMVGATLLDDLLIVRILDNDDELVQNLLRNLWCFLRPLIIKKKCVIPRVWWT